MSTITTRAGKGSPLTNTEVDNNFTNLNTDKLETSGGTLTGNLTISSGGTPQLTLYDSGNAGGGGATHRIDFENTGGVSTAILVDSTTDHSDLVITNNHASGYVDDDGVTDATSDIVLHPLTHVRIASGDLQMGTTTVIDSSRNATFGTISADGLATLNSGLAMVGTSPTISLLDSTTDAHDYYVHANQNNFYILANRDGTNPGTVNVGFETPHPLRLNTNDDMGYLFGERMFAEDYHPNADKWTSARTLTLTGDVTGSVSWDGSANASLAATVGNDTHTHDFNNLTNKTGGTGEYSTDSYITAGRGSGGVSLTVNDGYGNANISFNHRAGIPEQNGSALRIETNTDTAGKGLFTFEASGAAVTAGTAVTLPTLGTWDVDAFNITSGTLQMNGVDFVDQNRDVTPRNVNIVSSENDALDLNITDNVANRNRNAMNLTFDLSGADATTADRTKVGLRININSTATGGDTNHEHRVYGIKNDVIISGDSDIVYGQYNLVETEHSAGISSVVYGDYTQIVVDETGSGNTSNAYGMYGYVNVQSSGTGGATANVYGGYFRSLCGGTQEKNITNMYGVFAEVEIDNSANGVTVSNAHVVRAYYDNDVTVGDATVLNSYLFHGAYAGTLPNNPYGVYISSDVPNYFRGDVDVRGDDGLMVKNTADTHLRVQTQTDLASDYGIMRFYGRDNAQVGFLIGYGSANSTPNEISIKATHAAGKFSVFTNGVRRLRVENEQTTITNTLTATALNLTSDEDLTLSSTPALVIGSADGPNLAMDRNELSARDNGAGTELLLNHDTGQSAVRVNSSLYLTGSSVSTTSSTLDISVDSDASGSNQQIRFLEGGVVRMVLEDNDLYVSDNISSGRRYESAGSNPLFETGASSISAYASDTADGSGAKYRTFIQAYNSTDPDIALFQAFSKDVMDDTGSTDHNQKATAHILDNGGRVWSWSSVYSGRVRVGTAANTTAFRSGDHSFTAYSGTGNAHGHTTSAGYTQITGRETANADTVFLSATGSNLRHKFTAAGNAYNDGTFSTSNADYAEFFEWVDGNPDNEDRRGHSVVLTTDGKIRIATADDDTSEFLGIISVESGIVGDSAWASWTGMHERDRFGQIVYEDYELLCWGPYDEDNQSYKTQTTRQAMIDAGREADIPEDAITVTKSRKKFAADYDPDRKYIARSDRPEWSAVGLMGKLPLLKGQPTAPQWRKLFDLNDEVEMWLVR